MPPANHYGLILAGGRGTRFWPKSRRSKSKQVLEFFGDATLIQQTVERLQPVLPPERIWILTNHYLRDEIVRQLPRVPQEQILAEPTQRNTAPAIGLIAQILFTIDPAAVLGVFPADHYITKPERFLDMVRPALAAAGQGQLVVLGIQPRWPETGYGYIEFPAGFRPGHSQTVRTLSFREKPDLETAKRFLVEGRFCWNAGMFFASAETFLRLLRLHMPKTAALLAVLPRFDSPQFGPTLQDVFPRCENISIDFGVIEKAAAVHGLAADQIGWNDVGSWNAVHQLSETDGEGNAARTPAVFLSSAGNYVDAKGKLTALLGVSGLVVVDTPDALLIVDRAQAQRVGDLVKLLEKQKRDELL